MKSFVFRSILITLLTIALFVIAIFLVILPSLERSILEQKREMIRELTTSAWNILAKFENDEKQGLVTREQAQIQAVEQIRNLHYGHEMKDYFWINDMHPRMVSHPYRSDLNGKDLTDFTDPDGKRPFIEFVKIVQEKGAGYFSYRWQWKDDAARVVPKISYVKGFKPWNWIIGTGVYVDDVQGEIRQVKHQLVIIALLILLFTATLQFFLVLEGYRTEQSRLKAEAALRMSEERYRTLVESAGERIIMVLGNEPPYANQSMLALLGYTLEEFQELSLDNILPMSQAEKKLGYPFYQGLLKGESLPRKYETALRLKSGDTLDTLISISPFTIRERQGLILIASEITTSRLREISQERVLAELHASLGFLNRTCEEIGAKVGLLPVSEVSLGETLKAIGPDPDGFLFQEHGSFFRLDAPPIVRKIEAASALMLLPMRQFLSPLTKVSGKAPLFSAYSVFQAGDFQPLAVVDSSDTLLGILDFRHFVQLGDYSPTLLSRQIREAGSPESLVALSRRFPEIVKVLVRSGANTHFINQVITQNADLILERAIHFAVQHLGPPPARFAFLVMGSEGRQEQTLATDQDNAILFEDVPPAELEKVRGYFLRMGTFVCDLMAGAGFSPCDGQVMAKNEKWCQPLKQWKANFAQWIHTSEAEDLLQTKIFFDFRAGFGDAAMVDDLRGSLWKILADTPQFFFLLARNVLLFQPPIGLFGNFALESTSDGRNAFDIKGVMALVVDFARIYSLKHSIPQVNTIDRLEALKKASLITPQGYEEMVQAYGYLMKLRIENQIKVLREGRIPDNMVDPTRLTSIDQRILKEIFDHIKDFQVRLSYDFTGVGHQI